MAGRPKEDARECAGDSKHRSRRPLATSVVGCGAGRFAADDRGRVLRSCAVLPSLSGGLPVLPGHSARLASYPHELSSHRRRLGVLDSAAPRGGNPNTAAFVRAVLAPWLGSELSLSLDV